MQKVSLPGLPKPLVGADYLSELEATWGRKWRAQGLGKIKMVMLHRPGEEACPPEAAKDPAFFSLPEGLLNVKKMQEEHDNYVEVLKSEGIEVVYLDPKPPLTGTYGVLLRSLCYCHESLIINGGAIIERPAVAFKRGLEVFHAKRLMALGCPILYTICGEDYFESSNLRWLDSKTVVIGVGLRTNVGAVDQIRPILARAGVEEIHIAHLPGFLRTRRWQVGGMSGFFHLDMVFGMANESLGVIYPSGVGYETINYFEKKEINLIEVPDEELRNDAPNILAIEPGKVIIPAGNEQTTRNLQKEGVDVIEVDLPEHVKGGGGPTCMTLELIRE